MNKEAKSSKGGIHPPLDNEEKQVDGRFNIDLTHVTPPEEVAQNRLNAIVETAHIFAENKSDPDPHGMTTFYKRLKAGTIPKPDKETTKAVISNICNIWEHIKESEDCPQVHTPVCGGDENGCPPPDGQGAFGSHIEGGHQHDHQTDWYEGEYRRHQLAFGPWIAIGMLFAVKVQTVHDGATGVPPSVLRDVLGDPHDDALG